MSEDTSGRVSADANELATLDHELAAAAPLPRDNGELVFEEPWQGRALGMGVVVLQRTGATWPEFRQHLVAAIASRRQADGESGAAAYYAAWLDALEALVAERELLGPRSARRRRGAAGTGAREGSW